MLSYPRGQRITKKCQYKGLLRIHTASIELVEVKITKNPHINWHLQLGIQFNSLHLCAGLHIHWHLQLGIIFILFTILHLLLIHFLGISNCSNLFLLLHVNFMLSAHPFQFRVFGEGLEDFGSPFTRLTAPPSRATSGKSTWCWYRGFPSFTAC